MAKREKIILAIMAVVVLYGAWEFLMPKTTRRPPAGASKATADSAFVAQMNETLKQLNASQAHEHVMKQAAEAWPADPFGPEPSFVAAETAALPEQAPAPRQAKVAYTGFLRVGEKVMAIINGMEYEPGETIEPDGLVLEQIAPHQVVLKSAGQNGKLTVPLEENE